MANGPDQLESFRSSPRERLNDLFKTWQRKTFGLFFRKNRQCILPVIFALSVAALLPAGYRAVSHCDESAAFWSVMCEATPAEVGTRLGLPGLGDAPPPLVDDTKVTSIVELETSIHALAKTIADPAPFDGRLQGASAADFSAPLPFERARQYRAARLAELESLRTALPAPPEPVAGPRSLRLAEARITWAVTSALVIAGCVAVLLLSVRGLVTSVRAQRGPGRHGGQSAAVGYWWTLVAGMAAGALLFMFVLRLISSERSPVNAGGDWSLLGMFDGIDFGWQALIYESIVSDLQDESRAVVWLLYVTFFLFAIAIAATLMKSRSGLIVESVWDEIYGPAGTGAAQPGDTDISEFRWRETEHLQRVFFQVRMSIYAAAATLVALVIHVHGFYAWPRALVEPSDANAPLLAAIDSFVSQAAFAFGVTYSLILVGILVPAVMVLDRRANRLARLKKPTETLEARTKWLQSEGLHFWDYRLGTTLSALAPAGAAGIVSLVSSLLPS